MTISTYSRAERRGIAGRIRSWLADRENHLADGRETALENFNDHLLRDMGFEPYPSRSHRRHLMRF
jgi:hypothetical protein